MVASFIFATGNLHKLQEAQAILGPEFELVSPDALGCKEDIPETGNTLKDNALLKARHIYRRFHKDCFADDTGLEVDALHGAPGVYSARYAGGEGHDFKANMDKVLREMTDVPPQQRTARFKTVIALIRDGKEYTFEGVVEGILLETPTGEGGFGYDPIFRPEGRTESFAELSPEAKNAISHRGRALAKLAAFLHTR